MSETETSINENETNLKKHHRLSMKWKWALGSATGVFVIFVAFSVLMFQGLSGVLLQQERTHVSSTLDTVISRVDNLQGHFSASTVGNALQPSLNGPSGSINDDSNIYQNSVITDLSRDSTAVSVYNAKKIEIFSSRNTQLDNSRLSNKREMKMEKTKHFDGLVGRAPIYSQNGHKLLGYVQVANAMTEYKAARHRFSLILLVLVISAVFAASVFSYFLADMLLKPIIGLNKTMRAVRSDPQSDDRVPETRRNDELSDLSELFNDMLDQMQRYIDQQQQFVGDVSHELRTPVAVIQGHIEMLQRWGKDDPEVLNESLSAAMQETKRMQSLVTEMLDLTRAEQIQITMNHETSDIKEVVNQVFNDFKMIHPDFTFILDDDVKKHAYSQIYRNHLEQVLIILLDNAVKYSVKRKEIHLSLSSSGHVAQIAVQDFGEGISEENRERVFNRFYRVDKARSRNKGGNGLGLSIAKRLVEAYHGKVSIESALGYGSIFQIELPLISEDIKIQLDHAKEEDEEERTVSDFLTTNLGADPASSSSIPGVYRANEQSSSEQADTDKSQSDDDANAKH
ncbi:HAMP domain-containing histidine kinase [Lactobacillus sp. LC28-10]|uniref:Signal transduction histidine-protein kinase ArlS n=1 Tax=Secundilactobacillus angelensis TaxID=2722706 RepID=A0ABX1L0T6_9LACO|nr:HAMP domain-containing histidine kinase [Secundilactobacillus angelensis]MCH5462731.1 HAMP domain-containing histidine kinase [Secundilactobacillus angelensis]NLR18843.1 HAMP domain-containing histidine kinase [Secundilactobacillus angelensis]